MFSVSALCSAVDSGVNYANQEQLLYRIQLVKGLYTKYACAAEMWRVPGQKASDNTVPRLTERHFLRKVAPKIEKSKPQRKCVVCSKHGKKKTSKHVLLRNM